MKILITGGCGFIGTNLIFHLLEDPDVEHIYVIDKFTYASNNQIHDLYQLAEGVSNVLTVYNEDVNNISNLLGPTTADFCINLAAESHVDKSMDVGALDYFIKSNAFGSYEVAKFCFDHDIKMIQFSTDEVYGDLPLKITELEKFDEIKTRPSPRNPYSMSKLFAEHLIKLAEIEKGVYENTIKLRPCNQYGKWQDPTKLIPKLITNILTKKTMPIYGAGENIREWMYVEDTCKIVTKLLKLWEVGCTLPNTINIGSGIDISNVNLVTKICIMMDKDPFNVIDFIQDPRGNYHDARYAVNTTTIDKILGPEFKFTELDDGMKKTIDWYKQIDKGLTYPWS
jgi:dTDP-glucose 4,6-dehydratase